MNLADVRDIVIETAVAAGKLLLEGQKEQSDGQTNDMGVKTKDTAIDIVTKYDQLSEALILERLKPHFPDHHIVAEESGDSTSDPDDESPYTWHIDPLDGTVNYASGLPYYGVSIALYEGTTPLLGVLYAPRMDELFWAIRGEGAYLRQDRVDVPLRVSDSGRLVDCVVATGFPYDRHTAALNNYAQFGAFMVRTRGMRRLGAAALDLAYVAAGRLGGYWEFKVKSWDIAAGVLLVTEAGGTLTNIDSSPFSIAPTNQIVASNGRIHTEMVNVLATVPIS